MGWPTIFFLCHWAYSLPLAILSDGEPTHRLVRTKAYAHLPNLPSESTALSQHSTARSQHGTARSWCQTESGVTDVQAYVTSLEILKTQMQKLLNKNDLEMNFVANSGSATYFYGCPHYDLEQGAIFSNDIDTWCFGAGCADGYKKLGPETKVPRGDTGIPLEIESFFPEGEDFENIAHLKWKAELKEIYKQAKTNGPVKVTSGEQSVDILDCHSLCQFKSLMLDGDLVERGVVGKSVEKDGKISKHLVDLQDLHCLMRQCGFTREQCLTPNQKERSKDGSLPEHALLELYHDYVKKADLGKGPTQHATLAEIEEFKQKLQPNNIAWFNMIQNTGDPYRWITQLNDAELGILRQVNAIHSLEQMREAMKRQMKLKDSPVVPIVCSRLGGVPLEIEKMPAAM